MYKISRMIPLWLKQQTYNCPFHSKLCYGALVWGITTKTNYEKLVLLQKRVLRRYCNYPGYYANLRTAPLFEKYCILRADQIFQMKVLQIINSGKLYVQNEGQHHYPIRQNLRCMQWKWTNYGKHTFIYQTYILNKLDQELNFNCPEKAFKLQVKKILMQEDIRFDG